MHNDYHSKPHTPDTGPLGRCMPGSMLHSVAGDPLVSASVHSKTRTQKFSEYFPCLLLYIRLFFCIQRGPFPGSPRILTRKLRLRPARRGQLRHEIVFPQIQRF